MIGPMTNWRFTNKYFFIVYTYIQYISLSLQCTNTIVDKSLIRKIVLSVQYSKVMFDKSLIS